MTIPPFLMDENWYQNYWYGQQPRPWRHSFPTSLTRFALCILVVAGGAVIASELHHGNATGVRHAGSLME